MKIALTNLGVALSVVPQKQETKTRVAEFRYLFFP